VEFGEASEGVECAAPDWRIKRQSGSHRVLAKAGWPDYVFAYHDRKEIGPTALKLLAAKTGLRPEDI
jgi:hypothetical protein